MYFPLCPDFDSCLALQYVGFDVAVRTCDDFGEWRFRETLGQEDAYYFGQAVVAMCRASFVRLLVSDLGDTMSPVFYFWY